MNGELPDVQAGFRKGKGTRYQIANIHWIIGKRKRIPEKNIYFCFIDYTKAFDSVDHITLWKTLREMGIPYYFGLLRNLYADQQLELDMEQQTGSKLGKEYIKAVNSHPAYLTYMQNMSCNVPGCMKYKLESRWPGEISTASDMQISPALWQKRKRN